MIYTYMTYIYEKKYFYEKMCIYEKKYFSLDDI